ncbi:hypothetical protein ABG067_000271 [Albugo candida]|uniref:TAP42-like protein n=1 Tax=Albugo candida TaxID=65357 RepID=A0A024G9K3_9STRA|nr:unnamed protein product [Albugo candida]|eukprot:CCI43344.1 unnamed protein product [Albugo candida]
MSNTEIVCFDYAKAYRDFNGLEGSDKSNNTSYDRRMASLLEYVFQCLQQRQRESLLASNEQFHEMTNEQLYAVLLEFYLAICIPQQRIADLDRTKSMQLRIKMLQEADAFHTEFLDRMEVINLLSQKERKQQYRKMDSKQYTVDREVKIERFHRQRELENRLQQFETMYADIIASRSKLKDQELCDEYEEKEREMLLVFLELAVLKSLSEQSANNQERNMLESISAMDIPFENDVVPQKQGITVTRIASPFEMKREVIRGGVFQSGHRLPTVSLEQYAEEQLQEAKERDERQRNAPAPTRRIEQLEEDGDEDVAELVDKATLQDREWDDWKDANPRGIGNKKGSQF